MPDLTKGHVFESGDEVNHTNLNNLVGNAAINDGAITALKLADGTITNAKVSSTAAIALSKLADGSSGQVIVGASGDGVATYRTVTGDVTINDTGVTAIGADKVLTASILNANVTTAKIADNAVTADKLADTSVTADSYTNASITVDDQGRITTASSGSSAAGFSMTKITATSTWNRPTGALLIRVYAIGGGGGGGAGSAGSNGGSVVDWIDVTSVSSVSVTIGVGGDPNPYGGAPGQNGTNTTFGSYLTGGYGIGGPASGSVPETGTTVGSQDSAETVGLLAKGNYGHGSASGVAGIAGVVIVQVMG